MFGFPTALIEATSYTQLNILSQGQSLAFIVIVSDSILPSWVQFIPLFLRDKKTMSIQIYLPTLHYIKLLGLSQFTQFTWHNIQHQTCETSTSFLHSLQLTNVVLFNYSSLLFNYIYQPLHSSSTDAPAFLEWLTGHICLHSLSTISYFCWVCCHHSEVGCSSTLLIWFGYPILSDSGSTSYSPTQYPIYCPHVIQDFLGFVTHGLHTTPNPSCSIPHHRLSTVFHILP